MLIEDAITLWEAHEMQRVATHKKKASTLKTEFYKLRPVLMFLVHKAIDAITKQDLVNYQAARLRYDCQPVTVNEEVNTLHVVFAWAVKHGYLADAPTVKRVPQGTKAAVIISTPEEAVRVIGSSWRFHRSTN